MKEDRVFLSHILSAINSIELFMDGITEDAFMASKEKQSAVERQLEIIGEAVKSLSSELKEAHPDIPWLDIAGMRNNLIHEYFGVDSKITWDTVKNDIVFLKKDIKKLLDSGI